MAMALDAAAVYISPAGHRCRWEPLGGKDRHYTVSAYFVYLDKPGRVGESEGFTLMASHYGCLRREGEHAAGR